jgi:hypothetical protein
LQAQTPKFKPQSHQKREKIKKKGKAPTSKLGMERQALDLDSWPHAFDYQRISC